MNLARCNAHLLRGTLKKEASWILSAKIWNRSTEGVLGRIKSTFRILIKNAVVEGFCVPFHSYINENVNMTQRKSIFRSRTRSSSCCIPPFYLLGDLKWILRPPSSKSRVFAFSWITHNVDGKYDLFQGVRY